MKNPDRIIILTVAVAYLALALFVAFRPTDKPERLKTLQTQETEKFYGYE